MSKRSHNKKRNVGIIYEQLLAQAAKGIVENNAGITQKAQSILKRFFREGTELYKEHRLFKAMVEPHVQDGSLATRILEEAKNAARSHNSQRLEREKNRLIREINYSFGKGFYGQRIENYTDYATIQTLLNDWRKYSKADISRVTLYESKAHSILLREKKSTKFSDITDKEVDNLVVKVMTDKYNTKYGSQLGELQQVLIKQYVFNEGKNNKAFNDVLKRIKQTVLEDLSEYQVVCENAHVSKKIDSVKTDIRSLNINTLDDATMTRFLTLCDLSDELRRKD